MKEVVCLIDSKLKWQLSKENKYILIAWHIDALTL